MTKKKANYQPPESFSPPPVLDFSRHLRKESSTTIIVCADYKSHAWIHTGDIEINEHPQTHQRGLWTIEAKRYGVTDAEHDTAVMFRFMLGGAAFSMASGGRVWIDGFIAGDDPERFRVPQPEWDQLEGAVKCLSSHCKTENAQHLIVDNGKYIPPPNRELFDMLRGLRVEIITGRSV